MLGSTLFVLLSTTSQLWAQGSLQDYERSANLRERFRNKVFTAEIDPHWGSNNQRFWYRHNLPDDRWKFMLVNVETATLHPAFDYKHLAEKLSRVIGNEVDAEKLPIERLDFTDQEDIIRLHTERRIWVLDLTSGNLREVISEAGVSSSVQLENTLRSTQRTGEETYVTFRNEAKVSVQLFWVDSNGHQRRYASIPINQEYEQHTFVGHIWLLTDDQKRHFGIYEAHLHNPLVVVEGEPLETGTEEPDGKTAEPETVQSPNGQWIALINQDNIWLRNQDGKEFQLSHDGNQDNGYSQDSIYWSLDSKKLAAIRRRKAEEHLVHIIESSPSGQTQPKLHTFNYLKPGDCIEHQQPRLFDIGSSTSVPIEPNLFSNPWRINHLHWAEDSSEFFFLYNQRGHQIQRIVAVDANSGKVESVVEEKSDTFIDYSQKTYLNWLDDSHELIWMSEHNGWNHLYLYDVQKRQLKHQITDGKWIVRKVEYVDEERRKICFQASGIYPEQDPYYIHYCQVNLDGSNLVFLTEGDGTHTIQWSPDRQFLVDTWSRVDQPPVHELRRAEDGKLLCKLAEADWNELLQSGWQIPQRFLAKGRDGETNIYGVIWRPTNFDRRREYPVIEHIYAGPHGAFVPKSFHVHYGQQEIAELGFIVVQIDGMGTNWRSKKFHDFCWRNLKDAGFPDRIAWLRAAAIEHPEMDLNRVGIYGGSAGGQNALSGLLHHGDFYKVGVADCGCHDNRMDKIWWNEAWMGWPVSSHYEDNSNVTHAEKLQGKLLLIVGELDRNVDPASTMQVVNALIKADKDFDLLVIPGAGHGAAGALYGQRRQKDFFVRHLLYQEPRWLEQ
ncbi:MAG: prolyl oligopeptidase family serine peptidase [Candidatus Poribacteria bacterium]